MNKDFYVWFSPTSQILLWGSGFESHHSKVGLGFLSHRSLGMDPTWGSHEG